jgi:hypothetical protein
VRKRNPLSQPATPLEQMLAYSRLRKVLLEQIQRAHDAGQQSEVDRLWEQVFALRQPASPMGED